MAANSLPRHSKCAFCVPACDFCVARPVYDEGDVTLYKGDCIDLIPTLRQAIEFAAVVTDPPYGIGWRKGLNKAAGSRAHGGIANDEDTTCRDAMLGLVQDLPAVVFGSFYAPHPPRLKHIAVWRKPPDAGVVGSTTGLRRDVEGVFLVGPWPVRTVERSSLFVTEGSIAHIATSTGHPHTKPVDLMRDLIRLCPPGPILDPFCGSGATLQAAKQLGRRVVGIELDDAHVARVLARFAQSTLDFGGLAA